MGLLNNLRGFLSSVDDRVISERRMLTPAQFWGTGTEFKSSGVTAAGKRITTDTALALPVVQRAFSLVSGDLGTLAIDTFRRVDGRRIPIPAPAWVEVPDPANPNFRRPQFVGRCTVSLMSDGNLFVRAFPDRFAPSFIRVLDPFKVRIETDADGQDWYWVGGTRLSSAEVLHIPLLTLPHTSRGPSPIDLLAETIGTGLAAEEFGGRFFANGAVMTGIVEAPAGAQIDPDRLKKDLERNHRGVANSHAIGVLTGGATWKQTGVNAQDSQLLELQKFVVEDVGRAFGIPPYLLGSQEPGAVAYASTSNARIDYVVHGLGRYAAIIEHALSTLIPGEDTFLRFNMNSLLRGDPLARAQALNTAAQAGVITKDEWRAFEDWGPADEAEGVGTEHGGFLSTPNNTAAPAPAAPAERAEPVSITVNAPAPDVHLAPLPAPEPPDAIRAADLMVAETREGFDLLQVSIAETVQTQTGYIEARLAQMEAKQAEQDAERRAELERLTAIPPVVREVVARDERDRPIRIVERRGDVVIHKLVERDDDGRILRVTEVAA